MELVVIIYGIAWLIVLLYLLYIHFTEKDKLFRRDNWHVWLLVIAFTPIILLGIILYTSISCIWDKKKESDVKKEKEREEAKKKQAVEIYKKCSDSLVESAYKKCLREE